MDLYQRNYQALKTRQTEEWSAELMEKLDETDRENDCLFGIAQVDGREVLYAQKDEEQFQLDSLYDSDEFLDMWFRGQSTKVGYQTKAFFYGLGNGMYARKLLKELPDDGLLCVYEPSVGNIDFLLKNFDYQDVFSDKRFVLLVEGCLKVQLNARLMDYITYADVSVMIVQSYLNYNRLYADNYSSYMNELQIAVRAVNSTQNVYDRYGEQYFKNTIENIPYLYCSKSLHQLSTRIPQQLPAIIVAAGPSLDKNIEELKNAKNRALIIAVDSSLRVLLKHDIVPDLVVSIDGVKMPAHFDYPGADRVPLVCLMNTNYRIVEKHHGITFFTNDLNPHLQKFFTEQNLFLPVVGSGGSVANTAMSVAEIMDMKTIILVGQDLAYTDNKTHSVDSVRGSWGTDASKLEGMMVEGYDGQQVWSSTEYELYRLWIEEEILTHPELKIINATEGGAKIKGTEQMTLRDAIARECSDSYNMAELIEGTPDFMDKEQKAAFVSYMNQVPEELEECLKKVQNNKRLYQKMQELIYNGKYRTKELKRLLEQTTQYSDYLDQAPVMEYVKNLIQKESSAIIHDLHKVSDDERDDLKEITRNTVHYLEDMEQGIRKAKTYICERLPIVWEKAGQGLI